MIEWLTMLPKAVSTGVCVCLHVHVESLPLLRIRPRGSTNTSMACTDSAKQRSGGRFYNWSGVALDI